MTNVVEEFATDDLDPKDRNELLFVFKQNGKEQRLRFTGFDDDVLSMVVEGNKPYHGMQFGFDRNAANLLILKLQQFCWGRDLKDVPRVGHPQAKGDK